MSVAIMLANDEGAEHGNEESVDSLNQNLLLDFLRPDEINPLRILPLLIVGYYSKSFSRNKEIGYPGFVALTPTP